jgi:hypothetical protein
MIKQLTETQKKQLKQIIMSYETLDLLFTDVKEIFLATAPSIFSPTRCGSTMSQWRQQTSRSSYSLHLAGTRCNKETA